ncbi:Glu/Leu/Phe/Val family dehydrogenase [Candidatus Odyssella thessalonicensis]|uniref:Glu/Leu/Phe/Val family dehydrogenase n=1 Tax=Candidatus Odyssella thessalonicensis TaxID=84647 RepID=UPI000225C167|nr:Glu/Leu/Phe/Val dehydrogenase [Candidatus Odyssella thessalonicensis]
MALLSNTSFDNHELVSFCADAETGLRAIIAIHNTNRGPALGGCRFWNYASEEDAIRDALRLSRGMTYKAALANLQLGGGKAVIIGDSSKIKTPELMRAFGRFVEKMGGIYITAEDVGTSPADMENIRLETRHVVGLENSDGGSGDPSIITAYGVYVGIKAAVARKLKTDSLRGVKVAVQGLGHVGSYVVERLVKDEAVVTVADINSENVKNAVDKYKVTSVAAEEILYQECDVLSPCALGGIINDTSIDKLKCKIIAGAANNQLSEARHGDELKKRAILYAPDYVINAGGLINVTFEGPNYNKDKVIKLVDGIYDTLNEILSYAEDKNISTNRASDLIAESRFQDIENKWGSNKLSA